MAKTATNQKIRKIKVLFIKASNLAYNALLNLRGKLYQKHIFVPSAPLKIKIRGILIIKEELKIENKNFIEEIREKNKFAHRPIVSKNKCMFDFEKWSSEKRKLYMEETNLLEYKPSEMEYREFKKLDKELQRTILKEWIDKYANNSEISRHTKLPRVKVAELRKTLGFKPSDMHAPRPKQRKEGKGSQDPNAINTPVQPIQTPNPNIVEIKMCLENICGENMQKKIESLGLFLEDGKRYSVDFVVRELNV